MIIKTSQDLGLLIKRKRKQFGITQAMLAETSGVGVRFVVDLEAGKPTLQLNKALLVANMLGIRWESKL